jgi:hypothetical protein
MTPLLRMLIVGLLAESLSPGAALVARVRQHRHAAVAPIAQDRCHALGAAWRLP